MKLEAVLFYEWLAYSVVGVLALVNAYYFVFGHFSLDQKYQKVLGVESKIVGNKSAVDVKKVL